MTEMKKGAVAIVALVAVLASLFGVVKAFGTPVETAVSRTVKALEYQQAGAFDYAVSVRPSYFYGGVVTAPSDPIPLNYVESLNISFNYTSDASPGKGIQINAILENPGVWKKTVRLAAAANASDQSVAFPLDLKYFQDTADAINKDIGVSASSPGLTVQAIVPGGATSLDGVNSDFVQLLPIKVTRTLVTIGDALNSTQGGTVGHFDYKVKLRDNPLFGPVTLTAPTATAGPESVLGLGDVVFLKLIDSMKVNFSYRLSANGPVDQVSTEVKIEAIAENPSQWSKTYVLAPTTREGAEFTVTFPLEVSQFADIFSTIQRESGVPTSTQQLTLLATVHAVAQTRQGTIDRTFTQSISADLRQGVMAWSGNLQKTEPGSIETTLIVSEPARLWGRPVNEIRILSSSLMAIVIVLLIFWVVTYVRSRPEGTAIVEMRARNIGQKYKALVVEVSERPEKRANESVLPVESIEDLIKVATGLLKPVHHHADNAGHVYWVFDDSIRYEYLLGHAVQESSNDEAHRKTA